MILYFGRSRAIFYTGLAATAALALAVAYRRADGPFWLLILTVSLVAIIGSAVTTLVANIAAASCESRVLEKLHIALEPEEFISLYEKAARGQKHGSAQSVVGLASLADGYCAAGDWRRALKTLEEPGEAVPQAKRTALTALVKRNRCRYTLWGGNPKEARAALASFEKQLDSLKEQNPKLVENFGSDAKLYATWTALLEGGKADMAELEETMRRTPTKLAKFDLCQMLIIAARRARDAEAEERYSRMFAEEGGHLARAKDLRKKFA